MRGKRQRRDAQLFELDLMSNILSLNAKLASRTYRHSGYHAFSVFDPKPRQIHKASVEDRVLHRAVYRMLYPFFDRTFIADSYSCRIGKGTHKALNRFRDMALKASSNHTRTCWVLTCDVSKYFASIDQTVLMSILAKRIHDQNIMWLLGEIIRSFSSTCPDVGLPLGNLTSQLFANVYLNKLDQFMKHRLKVSCYARYADDFAILSDSRAYCESLADPIRAFLWDELRLLLHPRKVRLQSLASGVDFLGWIHFPDHRVLRSSTRRRMFRNLEIIGGNENSIHSYLGLLLHGNANRLRAKVVRLKARYKSDGNLSFVRSFGYPLHNIYE